MLTRNSLRLIHSRNIFYNYWKAKRGPEGAKEIQDEIRSIPLDVRFMEMMKLFKDDSIKAWRSARHILATYPRLRFHHGDCTIVYAFDGTGEALNRWTVASDAKEKIGNSWAKAALSPNKKWLIFSGHLDGGYEFDLSEAVSNKKISEPFKVRGLAALIAKGDRPPFRIMDRKFMWSQHTHIGLRIRGDGRRYTLILNTPGYLTEFANDLLTYPLYTRGGPYWQDVLIPFAKLIEGNRGTVKQRQSDHKPLNCVTGITISLMDRIPGPFKLELECVYVTKDELIDVEKNAYEIYKVPTGLFFR